MTLPRLLGGAIALDFVNTIDPRFGDAATDHLTSPAALREWGVYAGLGAARIDQRGFARALALRDTLYSLFARYARGDRPRRSELGDLRTAYLEVLQGCELAFDDTGLAWKPRRSAGVEAILLPILRSAVELLESRAIVRQCPGEDCGWLFVDATKNHSRRWCSMEGCGARAKMRRHRARRVGRPPDSGRELDTRDGSTGAPGR